MLRDEKEDMKEYAKKSRRRRRSENWSKPIDDEEYSKPKEEDIPVVKEKRAKVIGIVRCNNLLNVRADRTKNSDILTVVENGSTVYLDNHNPTNGWYKITTEDGVKGYVMKEFLEVGDF